MIWFFALTPAMLVAAVALIVEGVRQVRSPRRSVEPQPVYFPCPECGRPLDALNGDMVAHHGELHAEQIIARISRGRAS